MIYYSKLLPIPFDFNDYNIRRVINYINDECDGSRFRGCGSDYLPHTVKWCNTLHEGIGELEDVAIIDYGCGYGRFLNYMLNKKINNFKYYGLELRGVRGNGLNRFNENYLSFNDENRVIKFGFSDEQDLINEAIQNCNTILFGSVFTHWKIEDSIEILRTFDEIIKKGKAVFSLIIDKEYHCYNDMIYDVKDTYSLVTHTFEQLKMLTFNDKYKIQEMSHFDTSHSVTHTIFSLALASNPCEQS